MSDLSSRLASIAQDDIGLVKRDEPLREHCTWRIGGPADLFVEPQTIEQVLRLVTRAKQESVPLLVIGLGSNLLFDDAGVRGLVMRIGREMAENQIDGTRISVQAGIAVPHLASLAARAGLSGLEHACGIPGSLGGLIAMNGGSLGGSIGDSVVEVEAIGLDGSRRIVSRDACKFDYRTSVFQQTGEVIVSAVLECVVESSEAIRQRMADIITKRRAKHPLEFPNCGSVFTNNREVHGHLGPAGKIIEDCGLKGARVGDAEVSTKHANFIVNRGEATARDVLELIASVRAAVSVQVGVELECEVRYVSPDAVVMPAHKSQEPL
jgi:UDP-N-acetylmuramate dehydrogenase